MSAENSYRRLNRCGIDNCKTTLYYLEDGQWFCKNGHRREGELDLEEDDELNAQTQTGAKAKKAKDQEKEAPAEVLHGRKGFELFLKCIQLILRKQVRVLVYEKGFPAQLEAVVRDLWALRLQKALGKLKTSIPAAAAPGEEPILQDSTDGDTGIASAAAVTDTETYSSEYWSSDIEVDNAVAGEADPVKKNLLRRNKRAFQVPGLIVTIGLCYLGAMMLKVPVPLGDIYKWVESQELPYKATLQEIPENLKRLLSGAYIKALRPTTRLHPNRLQKTIHDLILLYSSQFGITFPEINWPILAMRYIRDLGLPLEIFHAVKRLLTLYPLTFQYPSTPTLKTLISAYPEAKLMSLILLSTKLLWGVDDTKRIPREKTEPAAVTPDIKNWERFLTENKFVGDSIFDWTDADVFGMSGEELDKYMDWYERMWLVKGKGGRKKQPDHLLGLFPTSNPNKSTHDNSAPQNPAYNPHTATPTTGTHKSNITRLNSSVSLNSTSRDLPPGSLRPGGGYPLWRPDTILPTQTNILLEVASAAVCLSREDMVVALRQVEVMFRDSEWMKRERRRKK
ncbi:hypothetical protein L211DRAFT_817189 [Terfezia boudieri ATCC MYA-4762]|uniref:Uncharacterized protein n=1 Tax=Terfezia boudieri ATCC MYA-4762 TaxID=1051890 RepID=A0A3N4ML74_9PEZI|nr:hypothetical protein L211DRAFT_817189 [Terfezia boudieri ATCC MYA-4762]